LKAAADLAKFGGKALLDSGLSTAEKLTAITKIQNNFYRDGVPYDVRRLGYESAAERIGNDAKTMLSSGKSEEDVARWAHAQRNQLKLDFRDISPPEFVARAEARNIVNYQNPLGPTIEQLRANGKTWADIINSATRSGGSDFGFGGLR
jgi:filamentous hemagglutinin